jgi:signal transduction histidine kinase
VVRAVQELFGCERVALLVADPDSNTLRPVAERGFGNETLAGLRLKPADHLISWLRVNEISLEVDTSSGVFRFLSEVEQDLLLRLGVKLCVPLVSMNRIAGLLLMSERRGGDLRLLAAVSSQAALAVENALLYRRQLERVRHMYRAEKLATAGQLASGVAHEIRNPLTAIRSTVQLLAGDFAGDPDRRELLDAVVSEVDRINRIITQLLGFARSAEFRPGTADLNAVIDFSLGLVAAQTHMQNVQIVRALEQLPAVPGDEEQLKQLLLNLLINSLQAMPQGGELRVESCATNAARVAIADTGCGMTQDVLDRVFDPFFTTKPEGTGLGLSVAYAIMERHRGDIVVRSEPGKGTTASLEFPLR